LVYAIQREELAIAKYLAERGTNVANKRLFWNADGYVLCDAGIFSDKEFIGILLSRGLDINCSTHYGFTCLHNIAERENKNEEELIGLADFLIQGDADLSSNNDFLISPLHCASHVGNSGLVKMFLEKVPKGEIDVNSKWFGTPLYAASFRGHLEVVRILLEAGADTNVDWDGQTPLEAAQEGDYDEVVRLLLEHRKVEEENDLSTVST